MANPPRTLLEMAKAAWPRASFDRAALVIVDAQREYVDGALPLAGIDAAIKDAALVLVGARRHVTPLFHVVQNSPPGRGLFEVNGPYVEIAPELTPHGEEPVIAKKLPNAFAGTDLATRISGDRAQRYYFDRLHDAYVHQRHGACSARSRVQNDDCRRCDRDARHS